MKVVGAHKGCLLGARPSSNYLSSPRSPRGCHVPKARRYWEGQARRGVTWPPTLAVTPVSSRALPARSAATLGPSSAQPGLVPSHRGFRLVAGSRRPELSMGCPIWQVGVRGLRLAGGYGED